MTESKREKEADNANSRGSSIQGLSQDAKRFIDGFIAGVTAAENQAAKQPAEKPNNTDQK